MISLLGLIGFYLGRGIAPQGGGREHDAHNRVMWRLEFPDHDELLEFLDHDELCRGVAHEWSK